MKTLLAIILGVHLRNTPPGMPKGKYLWRCFVMKFYWHKSQWVTHTGYDAYKVRCDDMEMGCLDGCRRQKKLREWEARDAKEALPKARLL